MDFIQKIGCGFVILWFLVVLFIGIGWIKNIVKFIKLDFQEPYKAEIIRGISIIGPIGGIVGWINIKDN